MSSVRVEHLSVHFGAHAALKDVDLAFAPGECVLVAGPSGSGKSTLACTLNGVIPQSLAARIDGRIFINGRPAAGRPVAELSREVGLVFQNPATQLFSLRVEDEICFGPRNLGLGDAEIARRLEWALERVGLAGLRDRSTGTLSAGERQRLALGAVLAMGPQVLVLDEPLANLDAEGAEALRQTVRTLCEDDGATVILIEHRLGAAAAFATRTVLLGEGSVVADGPTDRVLADSPGLERLGLRMPADGSPTSWTELLDGGADVESVPLVTLRGLSAGFGRRPALTDIDLTIGNGDFLALVGENGAGKTTLAHVLAGLLRPRRGSVRWASRRRPRPGTGAGLLFQDPTAQLLCETVEDEIAFGLRNIGRSEPARLDEALAASGLAHLRRRPVFALSLGEQQRLAAAAVLSLEPRLVVLDEPTVGQDWRHVTGIMEAARQLNRSGATVVLVTHDHELVRRYATRMVVLERGRIIAQGKTRRDLTGQGARRCA